MRANGKHQNANRPVKLPDGAALDYAPTNELGVVYLFATLAGPEYGLRVESVRAGYPDCIAYRGEKRVRIEFEYKSCNFRQHKHDHEACDWVVCWIHDWLDAPKRLKIVELRRHFSLGWNVWVTPVGPEYKHELAEGDYWERWSVPSTSMEGDLVLYHRTAPESSIADMFVIDGEVKHVRKPRWKETSDYMAPIRLVCRAKAPLLFSELKRDPATRQAGFVRGKMRRPFQVTAHWPEIYRMLIERNPSLAPRLKKFGPHRLT